MTAPSWMTEGASEVRKAQIERDHAAMPRRATLRGHVGEPVPNWTPTFTLERQVNEARASMGEERWQQLQREWNDV